MASKQCRLCSGLSGPFFNIFGLEVDLASRIKTLLPFEIDEWDNLPHKICYRCSAKVAELHEFVQKCIETQKHFSKSFGKKTVKFNDKSKKARETWEASLQAKKISNDEYCDELIKKALQSLPKLEDDNKELNSFVKDSKMKRAQVVLSRFESSDTLKKKKVRNKSEPADIEKNIGELSDNITFLDVSDVDSIYSCKFCNKIFTIKDKIKSHVCTGKSPLEESPPSAATKETQSNKTDTDPKIKNSLLVELPRLSTRASKKLALTKIDNETKDSVKCTPQKCVEETTPLIKPNATPVIPLANNSNLFLAQLPSGEYILLQNHVNNTLSQTPIQTQNSIPPNTNITNTNVTINAPRLYGLTESNNLPSLSEPVRYSKTKRRKEEPYPVGLFCRSSNDLNILHNGDRDEEIVGKSLNKMVDMNFENKQYQIMPHQKPGKLVIKTTTLDRNGVSDISHRIKKKKKGKPKKSKPLKNYDSLSNNETSQSATNEIFSADDDKPIFTFFNIDPMSNPSYVLPTPNTVQESQISTTEPPGSSGNLKKLKLTIGNKGLDKVLPIKNNHKCYICDLIFGSQNKLVSHIDTHFNEDFKPAKNKNSKKRKHPT